MNAKTMQVGFVGVGNLGAPMAHMIAYEGWPLFIYARRPEQRAIFEKTSAVPVSSLQELGERSELVCVMVGHDKDVDDVVERGGLLDAMRPGSVISIHSTVHPDTCRRLADLGARKDVAVVDAPVSGGSTIQSLCASLGLPLNDPILLAPGRTVEPAKLAVMVGADPEIFERCRPVFEAFGDLVKLLGPVGSGQIAKLVNNLLCYANIGTGAAAFDIGGRLGLDVDALADIIVASSGSSSVAKAFAPNFDMRIHPTANALMSKDVNLCVDLMDKTGVQSPLIVEAARKAIERT
jgi:3-hydroxyisobutyrate dehydrogenase-like beta-hydroxyacid dehydrogenase